jgi:hypothetical protein
MGGENDGKLEAKKCRNRQQSIIVFSKTKMFCSFVCKFVRSSASPQYKVMQE